MRVAVFSGSETLDIGPKRVCAIVSSKKQAAELVDAMWPDTGYWEEYDPTAPPALVREFLNGA